MSDPLLSDLVSRGIFKQYAELDKLCYLCGRDEVELVPDHLPPKCLFPKKEWSRLLQVPSCKPCNSKRKKDDEYFRDYIVVWSKETNVPKEIWEKVQRSWQERPSHRIGIETNTRREWKKNKDGLYVANYSPLAEKHRIHPVLDNIARGYYFSSFGNRISSLQSESFISFDSEAKFWSDKTVPIEVIPKMFKFRCNRFKNGTINVSNWYLIFYNVISFYVRFSWKQDKM